MFYLFLFFNFLANTLKKMTQLQCYCLRSEIHGAPRYCQTPESCDSIFHPMVSNL